MQSPQSGPEPELPEGPEELYDWGTLIWAYIHIPLCVVRRTRSVSGYRVGDQVRRYLRQAAIYEGGCKSDRNLTIIQGQIMDRVHAVCIHNCTRLTTNVEEGPRNRIWHLSLPCHVLPNISNKSRIQPNWDERKQTDTNWIPQLWTQTTSRARKKREKIEQSKEGKRRCKKPKRSGQKRKPT